MLKSIVSVVLTAGLVLACVGVVQGEDLTWNAAGGGVWDTTTANWTGGTGIFVDGDNVLFDDSAGGSINISAGDVSPASVTFDYSTLNYTLKGLNGITGATGLTKTGSGALFINNVNSYTGKTSIQGGTLTLGTGVSLSNAGVAGPLGAPSGAEAVIDLYSGAALQLGSTSPRQNQSTNRTINLAGDAGTMSIKVNDNDTIFEFGAVTTSEIGAKTLALFTGYQSNGDRESMVFNGALTESVDSPLSLEVAFRTQSASQSYVSLNAGGDFTGPITLGKVNSNMQAAYLTIGGLLEAPGRNLNGVPARSIRGSGQLGGGNYAGDISMESNIFLNYFSTADQVLGGGISGDGALIMNGTGALTLTGANTYAGGTEAKSGTLTIDGSLADATMTISGGSVDGSGVLDFNIDGLTSDLIDMNSGALNISGLNIVINDTGAGLTESAYVLVDYADGGALIGAEFNSFTADSRYIMDYDYLGNGNQIALVLSTQVWDGTQNPWSSLHWLDNGVGSEVAPDTGRTMKVNSGVATVSSTPGVIYSLDIASDDVGGTVTVASGGSLAVSTQVSVGANGTLNVNTGGSLNVTSDVNVAAGGSLTVAGVLDTPTLHTAGTTSLTGSVDTINITDGITTLASATSTQINATGGTLDTSGLTVGNLNVDGATVNVTGPSVATDLQISSGQMNLSGGNMSVATATFTDGGIDALGGALVVSDTVTLVDGATIVNAVGADFQMMGGNLVAPTVGNHREVRISGGGEVTLQVPAAKSELINVNLYADNGGGEGTSATLIGPTGGFDETWNQFNTTTNGSLLYSDGGASTVGYTMNTNLTGRWGDPDLKMLHGALSQFGKGSDTNLTINGLEAGAKYNVWIASYQDENYDPEQIRGNWSTTNTTDTVGAQTVSSWGDNLNDSEWVAGLNYVLFENVEASGSGEINFLGDAYDGDSGVAGEGDKLRLHTNGFQIEKAPEITGPVNLVLPFTEVNATATATVAIPLEVGGRVTLGGMTTAPEATLTVNSLTTDITLTNMTLGGGSRVLSSAAGSTVNAATFTVSGGTLAGGESVSNLGDFDADTSYTNLTLAAGATLDWTFVAGTETYIDINGNLTIEDGAMIKISLADSSAMPDGVDVKLLLAYDQTNFDLGQVALSLPTDWTSDGLTTLVEESAAYGGEEVTYLVLQNLMGDGVVDPVDGDATGDSIVNQADLTVLLAQFGSPYDIARTGDHADFNGDGLVDLADFVILRANWGQGVTPDASVLPDAAPEPATMIMLAAGLPLMLKRRRRRS
ncbi:MAG: PEP-CTERM sorting domain-containing protein [Phycisphaerales bacterium]|jgi:fibronectin-binding autotransporter adhesin|nr:PEP-CTERM sorting domain-containing protein [Phycisphaerales bacterium]